jgi:hypothetical protein
MHPDTQSNRRRQKRKPQPKAQPAQPPVLIAARRPGSPRLEKPSRRMKAASARPRTNELGQDENAQAALSQTALSQAALSQAALSQAAPSQAAPSLEGAVQKKREARIVQRREDTVDEAEQLRRRLLAQFMQSEGRSAITRAADKYFEAGFEVPAEQEFQLKLLEHFEESRVRAGLAALKILMQTESPTQLPLFRQRLRRLEDHAEEPATREAASDLRRSLPS